MEQTLAAVGSIVHQTFRDFECIVVDDGSMDPAVAELRKNFPDFIILSQENRGVSAARNRGIAQARGEWLAFLDSDDLWLPDKLQRQVEWIRGHPQYRICQTNEIWIRNGRRVNPMKKHRKGSGDCFERALELCIISPSAVMLRRDLLDEVGGFDESFPVCEDYELWLRVACREKIGLIEDALVIKHGGHADQLSRSMEVMDLQRLRAIEKNLHAGFFNSEQTAQALNEYTRKAQIVTNGCRKRNHIDQANEVQARLEKLRQKYI